MNILAIIPAREGSKRVPQKNFRPFANTTLVDLAIIQALESKLISKIVVSSDSKEVLSIASKYKGVKAVDRPMEISGDLAPAIDYVRHAIMECEEEIGPIDLVVILQPSSPFRSFKDIDACIELLISNPGADSCVSVVKVDHMIHPVKLKIMNGLFLESYFEDEKGRFSSQELPDIYVRNCAVYVTWRKGLEKRSDVIGKTSLGFLMPENTSIDINNMLDFEFAEYLFLKQLNLL